MKRRAELSEASMLEAEAQFPKLAARAGRDAYERALAPTGRVVKAVNGQIVETTRDGTVRIIGDLPPSTPVQKGMVLRRRSVR